MWTPPKNDDQYTPCLLCTHPHPKKELPLEVTLENMYKIVELPIYIFLGST
jgi:hypothetical protein